MTRTHTFIIAAILVVASALAGIIISFYGPESLGQGIDGGVNASDCEVSTSTVIAIGNQASTQLLAAHGRRAWAQFVLPVTSAGVATNTVSLAMGATAVTTGGFTLSTSSNAITMGLNTDLPYTGVVSAITNNGSTSIGVVECRY